MELNKNQKAAVETDAKKVLVIAASGSGKTRVIMERLNYLLRKGVPAKDIVAITFTNFAAQEMLSRIENKSAELFIGTIHSYANKLLKEHGIDTSEILEKEEFNKLLEMALKLEIKERIPYLLIDEFQDLCNNEYAFIKNVNPVNFMAVGDDWQSIYQFKGANVGLFYNLINDSSCIKFYLEENYRSAKQIINFASKFISSVEDKCEKRVKAMSKEPGYIQEMNYTGAIDIMLDEGDFGNWYILTRTNAELSSVENYLKTYDVPFDTFKKGDYSYEEINKFLENNSVKILTIHSAKGLESDKVIVIGTNLWNDEEKRICYVAATRAKKELYWCGKIKKAPVKAKPKGKMLSF